MSVICNNTNGSKRHILSEISQTENDKCHGNTLATSCEELTNWSQLCWEGLVQEEKGTIEYEMAGWHHQLDGHEFG